MRMSPRRNLHTFRRVNLTFGNIDSLQSGDFSGLTGLTELILRNNSLTSLPAEYDFVSDGLKRSGAATLLNTTAQNINLSSGKLKGMR